jgi:4-diphosphocytidyl-2-C-methyl-D-erythritol kinase
VPSARPARAEFAPAKVNLTLHVVGRRADGYHEIESLVAFAGIGDRVAFAPGGVLALVTRGPTAAAAGPSGDNLVLKAARLLVERVPGLQAGRFTLYKRLPVAAGLGGGSSDAAAVLRLLARHNGIALDDPRLREAARLTGADVPVCLDPRARVMRGIGEVLSAPIALEKLPAVLVNPGVFVPTKDVFAKLAAPQSPAVRTSNPALAEAGMAEIRSGRNDLEPPAIALQPVIADALAALRASARCRLARMSGSGATCFGLFGTADEAAAAEKALSVKQPTWWVKATTFGGR